MEWTADHATVMVLGGGASLATANTPPGVTYYLDEAARCRGAGASSAVAAMYRAALEHLLHDQGFTKGMLGEKIKALEEANGASAGPQWAHALEGEVFAALKDIGNGAVHTNGGDITKQQHLDEESLATIEAVFEHLLEEVYERPLRKKQQLARLEKTADALSKTK